MGRKLNYTNRKQLRYMRKKRGKCHHHHSLTTTSFNFTLLCKQISEAVLPSGWSLTPSQDSLVLCYISLCGDSNQQPNIAYSVTISENLTYIIKASSHVVSLPDNPKLSSVNCVTDLLEYITGLQFCPGNPEEKFLTLASERNGEFKDRNGNIHVNTNYHSHVCKSFRKCCSHLRRRASENRPTYSVLFCLQASKRMFAMHKISQHTHSTESKAANSDTK